MKVIFMMGAVQFIKSIFLLATWVWRAESVPMSCNEDLNDDQLHTGNLKNHFSNRF